MLAGCGTSAGSTETEVGAPEKVNEARSGDDRVFPGGQPLRKYEEFESYETRVNIVDNQAPLLAAMQEVSPDLDERDFADVVSVCDSKSRGASGPELLEASVLQFSKADELSRDQGQQLLNVVNEYAC